MKLKSYFAADVQSAIEQARQELGAEAMLLDSRPAPAEARHLGAYEVIVASGGGPVARTQPAAERFGAALAEMERKIERVAAAVSRSGARSTGRPDSGAAAEWFDRLVAAELDADLASRLVTLVTDGEPNPAAREAALRRELAGCVRADATLGRGTGKPRIVALVGPCASGKTTTLVKLAVTYGLAARRPLQILSTDAYRIAAADQLRAYAAVLGVGFQAVETAGALAQALEEHRHKDLILIDTPGWGPREMDAAEELAGFMASRPDIDTHLVLTASMRSADLTRAVDRFEVFRPGKLLFTKLDETRTYGPLINEAVRTGKALSFLAAGQEIPEDLDPVAGERLAELVLRGSVAATRVAAAA